VASVLLLLVGGMFVFYSQSSLRRGTNSLRWNRVQGQVISLAWHSPSEGPDYPSVRYHYSIDGQQYEGSNLCFGAASEASRKLPYLAANSAVTVFVNPANSHESVLLPGAAGVAKGFLGAGALLVIVGSLVAATTLRWHDKRG
jgi:hypothetical protein